MALQKIKESILPQVVHPGVTFLRMLFFFCVVVVCNQAHGAISWYGRRQNTVVVKLWIIQFLVFDNQVYSEKRRMNPYQSMIFAVLNLLGWRCGGVDEGFSQ